MVDVSDLFREKIDDTTNKYFVDDEWRDLQIEEELIKVKGQDEPQRFEVRYTHRGPVLNNSLIKNAQALYGNPPPVKDKADLYSLAWGGHTPGEPMLTSFINTFSKAKTLFTMKSDI